MIVPTSTSCWSAFAQAGGVEPGADERDMGQRVCAPGAVTVSAGP